MVDTWTLVMNEAEVTSTYFVLLSYRHHRLGWLVLNTFTSHELNWTELDWRSEA